MIKRAQRRLVIACGVLLCARPGAQCSITQLTFTRTDHALAAAPVEVLIGDWNLDGLLDVVSIGFDGASVSVLLATAPATFAAQLVQPIAEPAKDAQAGDVDGDGVLDLVIACRDSARVDTWIGNGAGAFGFGASFAALALPGEISLAPMDSDAALDLVVTQQTAATMSVARGVGDGSFVLASSVPTSVQTNRVRVMELNGDGAMDVAAGPLNLASFAVHTWLGDGALGLPTALSSSLTGFPVDLDFADWDGDGRVDFAAPTNDFFGLLTEVRLGLGDGKFGAWHTWGNGYGRLLASDLDHDGWVELVQWPGSSSTVRWYRGVEGGKLCFFSPGTAEGSISVAGSALAVASADLDGDGDRDVVSGHANGTCTVSTTLVGACPCAPGGLAPASVPAVGSTAASKTVTVTGLGMDCVTGVSVAGIALPYGPPGGYATLTPGKLTIEVPLLPVQGTVPVEIRSSATVHTFALDVLPNLVPVLTFAKYPSASQGASVLLGAQPGSLAVVGLSLSSSPTALPGVGHLSIGANGTSLWWLHGYVLGSKGWDQKSYSFGGSLPVGLTLYLQAVVLDPAASVPFSFSNELSASVGF